MNQKPTVAATAPPVIDVSKPHQSGIFCGKPKGANARRKNSPIMPAIINRQNNAARTALLSTQITPSYFSSSTIRITSITGIR
jgi:hypothetical protein